MSTVALRARAASARHASTHRSSLALLGCGTVGSALVRLLSNPHPGHQFHVSGALVRNPRKRRPVRAPLALTTDPAALLANAPAVVVELLGGVEPARALVLEALSRGIPVVTANKTLLARCGAELRTAAAETGTPLLYEAAVLAGVPFLGTFARRPHASGASGLQAIVNGTSNHVLTACADGRTRLGDAVLDAQRLGYAERDPSKDITGADAAEKLALLLQHFAGLDVGPDAIETEGIQRVTPALVTDAHQLGGRLKPVALCEWAGDVRAFVGPAFTPFEHPLATVDGVENVLLLETPRGRLRFQGPGAGPDVTAATVLDDVNEIVGGTAAAAACELRPATPLPPSTGWLLALDHPRLPAAQDLADYLAARGVFVKRAGERRVDNERVRQPFLTWPVERERLEAALSATATATGCETTHLRALERPTAAFTAFRQE